MNWLFDNAEESDPLIGNHTLLDELGIVTAYQGTEDKLLLSAFSPDGIHINRKAVCHVGDANGKKYIKLVSGDFNGDGKAEVAAVYTHADRLWLQLISLNGASGDTPHFVLEHQVSDLGNCNLDSIKAAIGFNDESKPVLILSWCDTSFDLKLWVGTFDEHLQLTSFALGIGPKIHDGLTYDLQPGIFSGETNSEFVVFYWGEINSQGETIYLDLFVFTEGGIVKKFTNPTPIGKLSGAQQYLTCISGAFLASKHLDGLVIGWLHDHVFKIETLMINEAGDAFHKEFSTELPVGNTTTRPVRFAVGDLNNDGVEELLIGIASSSPHHLSYLHLKLYNFANTLTPDLRSEAYVDGGDHFKYIAYDYSLEIGFLENNTGTGIVISTLGTKNDITSLKGFSMFSIGIIHVDVNLRFPYQYTQQNSPHHLENIFTENNAYSSIKPTRLNLALTLGNFNGKSLRVGKPQYRLVSKCNNIVAIINMIPTQAAFENQGFVSFTKSDGKQTSLGLGTQRSFTTSNRLKASLGAKIVKINKSIENTYGENFEKSFESITDITEGISVTTSTEDYIIMVANDFHTWEYPVFDSMSGESNGNIMLVFPTGSGERTKVIPALEYNSGYKPRHLTGNILSYSDQDPKDYDPLSGTFCNSTLITGSGTVTVGANWMSSSSEKLAKKMEQEQTIGTSVDLKLDFLAGTSFGIDYDFEESYSESSFSNYVVDFIQSTTIAITLSPFAESYKAYEIVPFVYWSTSGGYLKLDYKVILRGGYYEDNFSVAEATFHLPWAKTGHRELYSRDLNFINDGSDELTVEVTVHNDTVGQQGQTEVSIFNGFPGEDNFMGSATVASIGPRDLATLTFKKILSVKAGQIYEIYARIDNSGKLAYGIYEKRIF